MKPVVVFVGFRSVPQAMDQGEGGGANGEKEKGEEERHKSGKV